MWALPNEVASVTQMHGFAVVESGASRGNPHHAKVYSCRRGLVWFTGEKVNRPYDVGAGAVAGLLITPNDFFSLFDGVVKSNSCAAFAGGRCNFLVVINDTETTVVDHFVVTLNVGGSAGSE